MNTTIGKRDKRVALLLAAAFAWLFIGSLIIFHEEHVLGKHFLLNNQFFIAPKSTEKKGNSYHFQKPLLKICDSSFTTGIIPGTFQSYPVFLNLFKYNLLSSIIPVDPAVGITALRAPPAI